ncbi:CRISPR-associated endonuclease Cas2 [Methanobrevibacter sp.]|uniref:CRISPR-associated endonuclease Cas2 n=1 Tax=Methanobrevibacter sp. TaxID=66852 RepID=UPI0026DF0845|nr:CRISPR-associated endonuclease Cas2 [Methanobrevibacter sp.]MDO5824555.1 CRISPR-associated endonuclease Cas2 [Methanobrevibacter sp.]
MYLVIVYDINVDRVNKVHKFLKAYLHWQQNSVFEGKVTKSQYNEIIDKLDNLIDEDEDSIIIYKFPYKYLDKKVLGIEKNPILFIL